MGMMIAFVLAILAKLAADELKAWSPRLVERLIRRAVARLPKDQRERMDEEWRAYVNDTPGDLWKLVQACGFLRAARVIRPRVAADYRLVTMLKTLIASGKKWRYLWWIVMALWIIYNEYSNFSTKPSGYHLLMAWLVATYCMTCLSVGFCMVWFPDASKHVWRAVLNRVQRTDPKGK